MTTRQREGDERKRCVRFQIRQFERFCEQSVFISSAPNRTNCDVWAHIPLCYLSCPNSSPSFSFHFLRTNMAATCQVPRYLRHRTRKDKDDERGVERCQAKQFSFRTPTKTAP